MTPNQKSMIILTLACEVGAEMLLFCVGLHGRFLRLVPRNVGRPQPAVNLTLLSSAELLQKLG